MDKASLKKIFTPEQYQVELFKEKGFVRNQCQNCKKYFWTLDRDRKVCGDTMCQGGYQFIGTKGKNWDFHQTISELSKFFKKNGHEIIDAYPVVARWRPDIEFTIASIATFQPWVTNGTIDPPANPLGIPQPCLRFGGEFNDMDNIGRTGRHLSSFVMFGQHSFNSQSLKGGYWMDKCIDLNFNFLNTVLGIPQDEISYVEDIWMGGGNFGPNLESMAYGMEIVNSVFMQYANTSEGYREMDLKVIDVGWGVERVSWFSQGVPTIYDATFPKELNYLKDVTGVEVDKEFLEQYTIKSGLLNVEDVTDVKLARSGIAKSMGLTLTELNKKLEKIEALYAIGDHTRTLVYAFADGAVPSNVGGGYNLRTTLRRVFTLNDMYDFKIDISELMIRHAKYLSKSYPRVMEIEDYVSELLDLEYGRLKNTISKGTNQVRRMLKSKDELSENELIDLYQSQGISPEIVAQIGKELGKSVDVPSDFYTKVGELQTEVAKSLKEEKRLKELDGIETYPEYYEIPYKYESEGKIIKILSDTEFILDKTIIYPKGGGQHEDNADIKIGAKSGRVINSEKIGKAIVHTLSEPISTLKLGKKVKIHLDIDRREILMRHHSAVHIVGGAAREVLGSHIWQTGTDKSIQKARLDITHWDNITESELKEIERVANRIVMENVYVNKYVMERTEAEKKFGFTIYQGPVIPGKYLRIIEIPEFDVEACGGTHVIQTGEIGFIKLLATEKIQDGVIRITLTAGTTAIRSSQEIDDILNSASKVFKVPSNILPKTAERFWNEWKEQRKEIDKLTKELIIAQIPNIVEKAKIVSFNGVTFKFSKQLLNSDQSTLASLVEEVLKQSKEPLISVVLGEFAEKAVFCIGKSPEIDVDLNQFVRSIGKNIGGGGGGKGSVISGGGKLASKVIETFKNLENILGLKA